MLLLMDLLLMNGSFLAALTIWNDFVPSLPLLLESIKWFVTLSILWFWVGTVLDIYDLARSASVSSIIINVGLTVVLTILIHLAIPWLTPPVHARIYVLGLLILSLITVVAWRLLYAKALNQPAFSRRALVLGTGATAQMLMQELHRADLNADANPFRGTGYHVLGMVGDPVVQTTDMQQEIPCSAMCARLCVWLVCTRQMRSLSRWTTCVRRT
jgi:FlaA1/EpsC-like NDP-sugar epimerase